MDGGGGVQAQPGVAVFVVVPGEEDLAVQAAASTSRSGEVGPVFQCLELGLAKRVVVADVRSAVRLGDAEVGSRNATGLDVIEEPRSA